MSAPQPDSFKIGTMIEQQMPQRQRRSFLLTRVRRLLLAAALLSLPSTINAQSANRAYMSGGCDTPTTPFCDALMPPIADWTGHVFHLSQSYPATIGPDVRPWLRYDPRTQTEKYLRAVLDYVFDGNLRADTEASFDLTLNRKRAWYHAPWQDVGITGREFIHGLTRERVSRPYELAPQQTHQWSSYAVGFYNAPGGMILGRIWKDRGAPNAAAAAFPDGTVATKLLFTTASEAEVPYLKGAPRWRAYVYADANEPDPTAASPRAVLALPLLQIDVAVKDRRVADATGWVFGTFVYGGGPGGQSGSGWTHVATVGGMWGNDPNYSGTGSLSQTWINPSVHMPHLGYQDRLSGPVDYPTSSCLSCHSTGEVPAGALLPPAQADTAKWFRNIRSGEPFDPARQSTDYSLQTSVGIANFEAHRAAASQPRGLPK